MDALLTLSRTASRQTNTAYQPSHQWFMVVFRQMRLSNIEALQLKLSYLVCKMLYSQAWARLKQSFHYPQYLKINTIWTTTVTSNPTLTEQTLKMRRTLGQVKSPSNFSQKFWSIKTSNFDLALIQNCCRWSVIVLINEFTVSYHMK